MKPSLKTPKRISQKSPLKHFLKHSSRHPLQHPLQGLSQHSSQWPSHDRLAQDNLKLNLGSGRRPYHGFVNIDKADLPETDLKWDLEKIPLPFKENSVSEVRSEHLLEHLGNFVELLEDLYRITKPGGKWKFVVPYYKYEGTYRDPTHKCFFSENTFDYFTNGNSFDYYSDVRLKVLKKVLFNSSKTNIQTRVKRIRKYIPGKKFLNDFFWNLYSEVYFELEVVKSQPKPQQKISQKLQKKRPREPQACEWRGIK